MNETIAAISTPYGTGGIGIIRISGEDSLSILSKIFKRPGKNQEMQDHLLTYGHIYDAKTEKNVDEVLAVYMKAPKTYTGEDVVEINCHGGLVPLKKTLELVLANGAIPAGRGEFTERAFLNGRLDLSQAEAVMDMINAKADKSFDLAISQLEGSVSEKISEIRNLLMDVLVDITVNIDYPDEDIEILTYKKLENSLAEVSKQIEKYIKTAETGRILKEGLRVTIVGKPNVGKSSLLNNLLRETRAIVTDVPGTTRDVIEENLSINGISIVLTDTAGIRETSDKIESIGIEKSKNYFNMADIVVFVLDAGRKLDEEDQKIIEHIEPEKTIVVLNKLDLEKEISTADVEKLIPGAKIIEASMKNNEGIEELENAISEKVFSGEVEQDDKFIVTNVRHKDLLLKANESLKIALEMTQLKEALEIIETDIRSAYDDLGEIIGETVSDDVINEVFSRFCLGK